jgi:nicotinamidase-related amidase
VGTTSNFTSHFSPDDAALVLIDFQPQMFMGVESHDRNAIKNNLQIIAKSAKLFNVPTVLSTVTADTFSGPLVRRSPKGFFPGHKVSIAQRLAHSQFCEETLRVVRANNGIASRSSTLRTA